MSTENILNRASRKDEKKKRKRTGGEKREWMGWDEWNKEDTKTTTGEKWKKRELAARYRSPLIAGRIAHEVNIVIFSARSTATTRRRQADTETPTRNILRPSIKMRMCLLIGIICLSLAASESGDLL